MYPKLVTTFINVMKSLDLDPPDQSRGNITRLNENSQPTKCSYISWPRNPRELIIAADLPTNVRISSTTFFGL